jgi:hypothetical protein
MDGEEEEQADGNVGDIADIEDFGKPKPLQMFSSSKNKTSALLGEVANIEDGDDPAVADPSPTVVEGSEETKDNDNRSAVAKSLFSSAPSSVSDFQSWLSARKKQWDSSKVSRKIAALNGFGGNYHKKSTGVIDFVRNAALSAVQSTWQIIEFQELDNPGEFLVWTMTSMNQLQRLKFTVPRIVYVNIMKNGKEALSIATKLGGNKVVKVLPHGKELLDLYELTINESKFQRNEKSLDRFFNSSEVEGIYESQVPLLFRAILRLGCVAKVCNNAYKSHSNNLLSSSSASSSVYDSLSPGKFSLNDLESIPLKGSFHHYLSAKSAVFKRIYIYYSTVTTRSIGTIGILGLFNIKSTNIDEESLLSEALKHLNLTLSSSDETASSLEETTNLQSLSGKSYIWIINGKSSYSANQLSKPPFNRIYRKYLPNDNLHDREVMKFVSSFVSTPEIAFKKANERLEQIYRERNGPTIAVAQGGVLQRVGIEKGAAMDSGTNSSTGKNDNNVYSYGFDKKQWRSHLPALREFPLTVMPTNSLDEAFPAVGWQYYAAEKMIQRFLLFPRWFKDRLSIARYSSIPLCNFSNDCLTDVTDMIFARQLTQQRHLLWASETINQPDLGQGFSGGNGDDLWTVWSESQSEPVVSRPGIYRTMCIELDIFGLAICAIMASNELDADGLLFSSLNNNANNNSTGDSSIFGKEASETVGDASHYQSASTFSEAGCGKAFK